MTNTHAGRLNLARALRAKYCVGSGTCIQLFLTEEALPIINRLAVLSCGRVRAPAIHFLIYGIHDLHRNCFAHAVAHYGCRQKTQARHDKSRVAGRKSDSPSNSAAAQSTVAERSERGTISGKGIVLFLHCMTWCEYMDWTNI